MKVIARVLAICVISLSTACAHTGSGRSNGDAGESHRLRNTLVAVGAAVIVGAIVANQAQSNVRDALRAPTTN